MSLKTILNYYLIIKFYFNTMILKKTILTITEKTKKQEVKKTKNPSFSLRVNDRNFTISLLLMLASQFPLLSVQGDDTGKKFANGFQDLVIGEYITFGKSNYYDVGMSTLRPEGKVYLYPEYNQEAVMNSIKEFYTYVTKSRLEYQGNELGIPAANMLEMDNLLNKQKKQQQSQVNNKIIVSPDWIYLEDEGIYVEKYHTDSVKLRYTTEVDLGVVSNRLIFS